MNHSNTLAKWVMINGNQGLILGQTDTPRVGLNYW